MVITTVMGDKRMSTLIEFNTKKAQDLIKKGKVEEGLLLLEDLCHRFPNNGYVWLNYALELDGLSLEERAIPNYKMSLKLGLNEDQQRIALVCLASSFRNVGENVAALDTVVDAMQKYPDNPTVACFYSLILLENQNPRHAVKILGQTLLRESDPDIFEGFKNALDEKFKCL